MAPQMSTFYLLTHHPSFNFPFFNWPKIFKKNLNFPDLICWPPPSRNFSFIEHLWVSWKKYISWPYPYSKEMSQTYIRIFALLVKIFYHNKLWYVWESAYFMCKIDTFICAFFTKVRGLILRRMICLFNLSKFGRILGTALILGILRRGSYVNIWKIYLF